jgi:serine/threonine-protein kinase ULK/ATG1
MKKVGNYTLVSELGKGQFGVVYKAHNSKSDEVFAIKSITKASINSSPKLKELFDTEVKIMASIKHPNIMHLYELLETNNNYYLVLDYCRSGDMESYVKRHKGLGEDEAVYLLMQIMNGFKELHKMKIMHRDFKLANIFLNDDRAVIGDFGFAKSGSDMAQTKLGSPITMAPEILLNQGGRLVYTNKADLWSIGVCFFEMIFGNEPWPNVTSVEDLKRKVAANSGDRLLIPHSGRFQISPECRDLLVNLIELNPQKRIGWESFFNHKLFSLHQQKKAAHDMMKSIMFRTNKDNVVQMFNLNKLDKGGEFELNADPTNITGIATANPLNACSN